MGTDEGLPGRRRDHRRDSREFPGVWVMWCSDVFISSSLGDPFKILLASLFSVCLFDAI